MYDTDSQILFDDEAQRWEKRYEEKFYLDRLHILDQWLTNKGAINNLEALDVGCGTFPSSKIYSSHCVKAFGIDISTKMISHAQKMGRNAVHYDGVNFPSAENTFDIITMFNVIEFVNDADLLFKEINRVSKQGALFLFTIVNYENIIRKYVRYRHRHNSEKFRREWVNSYNFDSINSLLSKSGFSNIKIYNHSMPTLYDRIFSKTPEMFLPLFRNKLFSDCIYIEATKNSNL